VLAARPENVTEPPAAPDSTVEVLDAVDDRSTVYEVTVDPPLKAGASTETVIVVPLEVAEATRGGSGIREIEPPLAVTEI
jgi:hypothetical protein